MPKRILLIIASFVLCIGLIPLLAFAGETDGLAAGQLIPQADTSHVPQNVKVQFIGTEVDSNGQKWLVSEVSWDGDSLVNYNELYPLLLNTATGEGWLIPSLNGQTIVRKGADSGAPDEVQYDTENGRNYFKLKVPILNKDDQQITSDENGTKANGLKEGDTGAVLISSIVNNNGQWQETEPSDPVEIVYTEENVKNKRTFPKEQDEPQEPKNVAIAKMVTSDGKISASQTVSWSKSQASISFRPGSLEGYNVSPAEHIFTKDGEVFTFTYTPTESMETVTDVTVTVNYTVPAGYSAPASQKATGQPGANYQIDSPDIRGLVPSQRTVTGQFGKKNETFTVSYSGKETTEAIDDRVVAVPPERVYTYNGHFQEGVPEHVGYKPAAGSINHARLPGVYQVMLTLSAGYRWSDGSTDPKMVTWAINPAPLSSMVLDRSRFDTAQDLAQKPNVVAVIANGIVVPQGAYSVTYSNPTSDQPGIYSVTVTATDSNFTGKLTETYSITETVVLACPHHGEKVNYMSNGDKATHDEECAYCNKVLVGKDHQPCTFDKVGGKVVDKIDPPNPNSGKPTGQVFLVCSKCNQSKPEFETCLHEGTRAFRDNGDGNHTEYCTRCGLDLFVEAHEMVDEAVKTPVSKSVAGQTAVAYQGTYAHKCSKCSYRELKQCPHEKTHVVRIGGGDFEEHNIYCDLCKAFVNRVKCSNFKRTCINSSIHSKSCTECGSVHGYFGHAWQRQITKVDAIPRACKTSAWLNPNKLFFTYYDYRIHYTETCKQCSAKRVGAYIYKTSDANGSLNYKKAFQDLVNMNPDELANAHSIWEGNGLLLVPVGNYLVEPLLSTLQPVTSLVGWDSVEYASLDFLQLVNWEGSTESPGDGYSLYDKDGKLVETAKVPGDVPNPAWSVESASGTQTQGLQAQEVLPKPVDGAERVPDLNGATEAYVAIRGSVLASLADGPHTFTVCGLLENGERTCSVIEFTIETVDTANGPQKMIKNPHPLGASVDEEGYVVNVHLSTDTVAYTGSAVEPPIVTVAKTQASAEAEGGYANVPLDPGAYKLAYYRIEDTEGGEPAQVEVNPAEIADAGSYCVVATPAEGAGWSGEAFANFRVARTFESTGATMTLEYDRAEYTGAEIEPTVTVKATVNGKEQILERSYAFDSSDDEQDGETTTTLTQGGAGDYKVQYKDNVKEGKATVTVTGEGLWAGTLTKTFSISSTPPPANSLTELELSNSAFTYNGTVHKPIVTSVKAGSVEVGAIDYSVAYPSPNATAAGTYQVYAIAETDGDFVGTASATYRIEPAAVTSVELEGPSAAYTGAAQAPVVKSVEAGELTLGADDYTVNYADSNGNEVAQIRDAGTYTVKVTGKGNFAGTASATFTVTKLASSISLEAQSKEYTGKTITYSGKVSKQGSSGAVSYSYYSDAACNTKVEAANVKNVGLYYVKGTVEADSNYEKATSSAVELIVLPKGTSFKKVTAKKKGFTAKWAANKDQTTGYQIRYAPNSKFKSAKTVTVKKNTKTSAKVAKLKPKKKYYVQIRTYKTVGVATYYSTWSKAKTVTTKK